VTKALYIILILLFLCSSIGYFFFQEQILFFIHGYKQNLINSDATESYVAFRKIALGKKIFFAITFLIVIIIITVLFRRKTSIK